jgi:hypothetical protein
MNNTPIQSNTIYMQACIKRMFAAIALIIALMCPHAHALDTSPHWEEIAGVNRYGYCLRWSVDQDGNVIVNERTSGIGSTWFIPGGGSSLIEGEPSSVGASIRLHGHAYSYVNPWNYVSDSAIDWDMTAQMTTTHDATEGTLGGYHDLYPTYIVQIDGARVHYSHQGDFSGLGNPVGFSEWFKISRL